MVWYGMDGDGDGDAQREVRVKLSREDVVVCMVWYAVGWKGWC